MSAATTTTTPEQIAERVERFIRRPCSLSHRQVLSVDKELVVIITRNKKEGRRARGETWGKEGGPGKTADPQGRYRLRGRLRNDNGRDRTTTGETGRVPIHASRTARKRGAEARRRGRQSQVEVAGTG